MMPTRTHPLATKPERRSPSICNACASTGYGDFRKLCMELFPELRNAVRAKAAPGLFQNDGKPARAGVLGAPLQLPRLPC